MALITLSLLTLLLTLIYGIAFEGRLFWVHWASKTVNVVVTCVILLMVCLARVSLIYDRYKVLLVNDLKTCTASKVEVLIFAMKTLHVINHWCERGTTLYTTKKRLYQRAKIFFYYKMSV